LVKSFYSQELILSKNVSRETLPLGAASPSLRIAKANLNFTDFVRLWFGEQGSKPWAMGGTAYHARSRHPSLLMSGDARETPGRTF
jgi:hypothetical protein